MTLKKNIYEHTPTGRILKYNVNYDVDRFSFVSDKSSFLEKVADKLNSTLNNFVGSKPYEIIWDDIVPKYLESGVGDVPHFASQYVFGTFLMEKRSHEKENMQAMYLEIVDGLNGEIEKGHLPGEIE